MTTRSVESISRRQFLVRLGTTSAVITVAGSGVSALLNAQANDAARLQTASQATIAPPVEPTVPVASTAEAAQVASGDGDVTPAPGTRPEYTPVEQHYRIDIAAIPPVLEEATWKLQISGLVDTPLELTLDDIRNNYPAVEQLITMACISNSVGGDLISTTRWTGASFRDILADAGVQSNATHAKITSADGFDETVALDLVNDDPEVTLNYAWDGEPLPIRNGFPIRIHIPNRFGMKQPKWITRIELIEGDQDGYWVRRGWSKDAILRATSVIDTVAVDDLVNPNAEQPLVPIGGIAWAGPRGISKVEVQVDGGDWVQAQMRKPLNGDLEEYKTWRIWRYDWPYVAGNHTITVRMYEADGTPQIEQPAGVRPDGATGYHSVRAQA